MLNRFNSPSVAILIFFINARINAWENKWNNKYRWWNEKNRKEKKTRIFKIKFFELLIYSSSRNVPLWAREATWWKEWISRPWSWCVYRVDWPWSLVVMLTACPFAMTAYSGMSGVFKSRWSESWHRFCHVFALVATVMIVSFYLFFFFQSICFVSWVWCSEPIWRGRF